MFNRNEHLYPKCPSSALEIMDAPYDAFNFSNSIYPITTAFHIFKTIPFNCHIQIHLYASSCAVSPFVLLYVL